MQEPITNPISKLEELLKPTPVSEPKLITKPKIVPKPKSDPEPAPKPEATDINIIQMESIIIEKLQLIEKDSETNRERIRELWDDIQILAFMEEEDNQKRFHNYCYKSVLLSSYFIYMNLNLILQKNKK